MKVLLTIVFFAVFGELFAQGNMPVNQPIGSINSENYTFGLQGANYGYRFRTTYADTFALNLAYGGVLKTIPSILMKAGNDLYLRSTDASQWIKIASGTLTSGTVTSVGALSPLFTTANATTTPTFSLISQSANKFFASPNGSSGVASFRSIVAADLPSLSSSYWSLTGNSGTTVGTNFLGTTDNKGLMFKTNSLQSGYIDLVHNNTSFGSQSLLGNTSGARNVAVGESALTSNETGNDNVAVGLESLQGNTAGNRNVAVGKSAGNANIQDANTYLGAFSAFDNQSGSGNVAIGDSVMTGVTNGSNNTFVGYGLNGYSSGLNGYLALAANKTEMLGINSSGALQFSIGGFGTSGYILKSNGSASPPTWIPQSSIVTNPPINTLLGATGTNSINNADFGQTWAWNSLTGNGLTLSSNSTMGVASALFTSSLSGANDNPSVTGYAGIFSNTRTGTTSTNYGLKVRATGATNNYALQLVDGSQGNLKILQSDANGNASWINPSTIVGAVPTLQQVTTAGNTTSLGITVQSLTVGRGGGAGLTNTAFGISALSSNTSGSENTAVGSNSLSSVITGAKNTSIGSTALSVTTGSNNTGIGAYAGAYNTTGSNQYFINSIDRNNYLGDTAKSPIWIQQNATVSSQRIKVNGLLQINDGTQGVGKVFTSDADGLGSWATPSSGVTGSGTTNSVARWISSSALGTGIITDNNAIVSITPTVSTGTTTSSGISVVANSLTSGTAMNISSSSATTGTLMNLSNSNGSSTGTPLLIQTATGFTGNLIDAQLNGGSRFSVSQVGSGSFGARVTAGTAFGGSSIGFYAQSAGTPEWSILDDAGTTSHGMNFIPVGTGTPAMEIAQTGKIIIGTNGTPNSGLQVNTSFSTAYVAKTANYTLGANDYTVNFTSNADTATLPTAVGITGRIYVIVNSGLTVFIQTTSGQTFANVLATPTTLSLSALGASTFQSNGANWLKLN